MFSNKDTFYSWDSYFLAIVMSKFDNLQKYIFDK